MASEQNKATGFVPVLYHFRVQPKTTGKTYALQQPFATLWDNLITVLWSVYGKGSKNIQIGITQLQWALEFMKCMKVDYGYPESIEKIVNELEDQLIALYAKVGQKLHEIKEKKAQEEKARKENEENNGAKEEATDEYISYNEKDIMGKLEGMKMPLDPETGEIKYLTTLNALGKRKSKLDECNDKKDSKNSLSKDYMIGALKKVLAKPADDAKNEVEELIKQLEVTSGRKSK
ncbi:uncharacterized protein LOC126837198 [Adelges cooleyi]|uniref:uncharacterized protein LOC126837198 n=1 Tax=Adelges cooleyi TaxID=133065 RepID=UPI00217F96C7|nr:uncharacterized protein LOC126837198 [Adelges cooleyi]